MKHFILGLGYSDINGHGNPNKQRPLENGDHVFAFKNGMLEQNPVEPIYAKAPWGSTPLRSMADELAGRTGDDVAFAKASNDGKWHDGLQAWDRKSLIETKAMLQPAFDAGFELTTVVIASGPGAADTEREVDLFDFWLNRLMHRIERIFDGDQHFVVVPPHLLTPNRFKDDLVDRLAEIRHDVGPYRDTDVVRSGSNWGQASPLDGSHLDARGNEMLGHRMAHSIFDDLI